MATVVNPRYFVGQGEVFIAARNASGVPQAYKFLGNAPKFMVSSSSDSIEHRESYTGRMSIDAEIKIRPEVTLEFDLDSVNQEALETMFKTRTDITSSVSVTNEAAIIDPVSKALVLKGANPTAVVVRQTTGSTVVATSNYDVLSGGLIQFKPTYTPPGDGLMNCDYTSGVYTANAGLMASLNTEYSLAMIGTNLVTNQAVRVEIFRTKLLADGGIPAIGEDFETFSSSSRVLLDSTRASTAVGGQYYAITFL